MPWESWQAFYASDLQSPWLLLVAPALFLAWRALARSSATSPGVAPELAGFVVPWCLVFALGTLLDPLCTGPLVRALGWQGLAAQALMVSFVLIGDFRIWWLVFHIARPGSRAVALALLPTLAIPVCAYAARALLDPAPDQLLWLLHETLFLVLALWLRARWLPRRVSDPALRGFLAAVLLYAAGYYFLWAAADLVIMAGLDFGWGLRVLPNQLYYAFSVPFVWWRFFAAR